MNPGRRNLRVAALLLIAATLAAYANSLRGPFIFDDAASIVDNPTIRQLWPPTHALHPPNDWGFTVSGRPILNFSLALNYAISRFDVWSYHALNLAIHALAGLALFGFARRTLLRLATRDGRPAAFDARLATPLAFLIALLWLVHPLQTEAVTYIVQRAESLMGLFFFLTLYCAARAFDSPQPRRWWTLAFLSCLVGAGTKETTALAPLLVLLYDRTFVSGSFRAAWQRHRWRHLALAATWLPLAALLASTGGDRGGTVGFGVGMTGYWLTQFEALVRYVALVFWPHPQVFDYGKLAPGGPLPTLLWALPVLALLALTLFALWRRPVAGFLGAWFFVLLAPTSLVPGTLQMIVEHRMYLPGVAVIAAALGVAAQLLRPRVLVSAGLLLALAAGALTAHRNTLYRDPATMWRDILAHRPANARAHNNLGFELYRAGRIDAALAEYRESLRLDPSDAHVHYNLGLALMRAGQPAAAVAPFAEAVRILPYYFSAHLNLAIVLVELGRAAEALPHLAAALRYDPEPAEVHFQWGVALAQLGRWPEAGEHYALAAQLEPARATTHANWGVALFSAGKIPAAIEQFEIALRLNPQLADAHYNLGLAIAALDRPTEAIAHYESAVQIDPRHAAAQLNLGIALAQSGKLADAIAHLEQAAQLRPDSPAAHTNLATALISAGRTSDALAHYETALRLEPGNPQAHYNVGYALLAAGRTAEGRSQFEAALRLRPDFAAAREMLNHLPATAPR
ncbi:MAG TPA: tetratricopeptide repeat protein [Opitutaceae bacterium]|nr:tetratricopeptide repeat protein [Opitutaceae bacterium]